MSAWKYVDGKVEYAVTIPANTTAEFIAPDGERAILRPGQWTRMAKSSEIQYGPDDLGNTYTYTIREDTTEAADDESGD